MVVIAKTSNKLIRIRGFHIDYLGHGHRQALLSLQTVNAQKNLEKKFKSNLDIMIRSDFGHQTASVL